MKTTELIEQCDFHDLVSGATKLSRTRDNEYKGLSPFSQEKTPSFFVNNDAKTWYCFSSGKGGGVLDYIMEYESLDRDDAIKFLGEFVGVDVSGEETSTVLEEAQKYFRSHVGKGLEYLIQRGISAKVASDYGLGFCTGNDLITHLKGKGFTEKDFEEAGLVNDKGNVKFYNRVTLPIKDAYGRVVSFTGRAIDNQKPKYLHGPSTKYFNKKRVLWNLHKVRRDINSKDMVIACEGQLDAISITEAGYPAVSLLGTNVSEHQIKTLANMTKNIYFMFDSDDAGQEALQKSFGIIEKLDLDVITYAIVLPGKTDPDTFIREFGVEEFQAYVVNARPDTSAIIQALIEKYRNKKGSPLTKSGLTRQVMEEISPYVEKEFTYRSLDLIERLSQEFGLNKKQLHDWFAKGDSVKKSVQVYQRINEMQFPAPIYERRLLYHLISSPSLWALMKEEGISENDFDSFLVSKVLSYIHEGLSNIEFLDKLKEHLSDEEYYQIMAFFSIGVDGDFETSLRVMKLKLKEKTMKSPAVDFLGRPKTQTESDMTAAVRERLFEEKEPF